MHSIHQLHEYNSIQRHRRFDVISEDNLNETENRFAQLGISNDVLEWDAKRMKVKGTDEYNELIKPTSRPGWGI